MVVNIAPHNAKLKTFIRDLKPVVDMRPDALIMSDPGLIMLVRENFPEMDIHLSVQANAVNWATVKFWKQMGLTRVILSRELSLDEIEEIRTRCRIWKSKFRSRCAVHGLLRALPALRLHQQARPEPGTCTNACRWEYNVQEAKRTILEISSTSMSQSRLRTLSLSWASARQPTAYL